MCTKAVEATVHLHLEEQRGFLRLRDPELFDLISEIQVEELEHLEVATSNSRQPGIAGKAFERVIVFSTEAVIWLSTWGDSRRLKHALSAD